MGRFVAFLLEELLGSIIYRACRRLKATHRVMHMEYLLMQEASSGSIIPRAQKANQGNSGATSALMLEVPSGSALTVGQHGAKGRPGQCQRDVCLLRALLGKTNCRPAGNQGNNIMLCLPAGGSTCWAAGNACCDWGQNAVWLAALSRNAPCSKL